MGNKGAEIDTRHDIMHRAYISLGSNVGDREAQLHETVALLGTVGRVAKVSSFYETEPVEFTEQPWFLNCAAALETDQTSQQLMKALLRIEEDMGRRRLQKKGPRQIDIDILLFDDEVVESEELRIPHPGMAKRRFVLEPLAEIAPEVKHPVMGKTVREMLRELPEGQVVRRVKSVASGDALAQ